MFLKLNLQTEWLDSETVRVSWNEPHMTGHKGETVKGPIGYAAGGCIIAGVLLPFLTGAWILLALLPLGYLIIAFGMFVQPLHKSVEFGREQTRFKDSAIKTADITRIAVDSTFQWSDLSDEERKKSGFKTQILLWVNEEIPFELSVNKIPKETSLLIRNTLDKALSELRKTTEQQAHEEKHGKSGEFGMPEY